MKKVTRIKKICKVEDAVDVNDDIKYKCFMMAKKTLEFWIDERPKPEGVLEPEILLNILIKTAMLFVLGYSKTEKATSVCLDIIEKGIRENIRIYYEYLDE